jgi:lipoprotein-anchoring transpeptidase ErfK/SrfK
MLPLRDSLAPLSRREFIKLSLFSLWIPFSRSVRPLGDLRNEIPDLQGRVLEEYIIVYDIPSFSGKKTNLFWRDSVLPITDVTVGDNQPEYNRIWYRIGDEGYAHSGTIQPVRTILNEPNPDIPPDGVLGEVTVPFTDAYWGPGKNNDVAYRYYFETTYWVIALVQDSNGNPWYRILEDKWEFVFYVPASHLRLIPDSEIIPISPTIPLAGKRLEIRTAEQVLIAYEWDNPVFMAKVATGGKFSDGTYYTPPGRHITFHKRPSRHMARGNLAANGYDLPGVPWVSYITEDGISLHGTFWHNDFGKPRSHGCINLSVKAAKWVYRWTLPYVPPKEQRVYERYGTPVDVF